MKIILAVTSFLARNRQRNPAETTTGEENVEGNDPINTKEAKMRLYSLVCKAVMAALMVLSLECFSNPFNFIVDDMWYEAETEDPLCNEVQLCSLLNKSVTSISIPQTVTYVWEEWDATVGEKVTRSRECAVVAIGALFNYKQLENVSIPLGVRRINARTFEGLRLLSQMTIPDSVITIGGGAFAECSALRNITIPSQVVNIGSELFSGCSSLETVTILANPSVITDSMFRYCASLTNFSIPCSVKSIGSQAFKECSSLMNIIIPNSVTNIGAAAFQDAALIDLSIPSTVVAIGSFAFRNCLVPHARISVPQLVMRSRLDDVFGNSITNLQIIVFDESVSTIHEDAFRNCSGLTTIEVDANNEHFFVSPDNGCLYDAAKTKLLFCPRDATNITIPDGVTAIGNYAFHQCGKLVSVTMPDSLKEIGMEAFAQCTSLQRVSMPNALAKIGGWAFYGCEKLSGVTIPPGVTSLPMSAFDDCSTLWTEWYRKLADLSKYGPSYTLAQKEANGVIASITVSDNMALDEFVMSSGKVYDLVLYINNISSNAVTVSLPEGNTYKTFRGAVPLTIPPLSQNILTITRVSEGGKEGDVFLVSREELEPVK